MDKKNALNLNDLEAVSGGAASVSDDAAPDKHLEFQNAWISLGLSQVYQSSDMEEKYNEWIKSGSQVSAFDFLLPLSK